MTRVERELFLKCKEVLMMAQERLETGEEVNRSKENIPRVTATSAFIRQVLSDLERLEESHDQSS